MRGAGIVALVAIVAIVALVAIVARNQKNEQEFEVPVIEGIHQKVLEAVSVPGSLETGAWHTCGTTHCRAGWVVTLAGEEGKKLEEKTDTAFAAMMIYKASSAIHVPPTRFYESNEVAMKDIVRCAEEEAKLTNQN